MFAAHVALVPPVERVAGRIDVAGVTSVFLHEVLRLASGNAVVGATCSPEAGAVRALLRGFVHWMVRVSPFPTYRLHTAFALAVVAALISGCGDASAPTAPSRDAGAVGRVVVLGDSLAVAPALAQSFPAELQLKVARAALPFTLTNAGLSGDSTAGGVRRLPGVLADDVTVLIVALGANDGLAGIAVDTVEAHLATIIETAQARNIRVLLCGMDTPPLYGWAYTVAFHGMFPRLARRYDVPLVPFLLSGVALVPEMNGPDGIHPNVAGARRIADNVWSYLEPILRANRPTQRAAASG